MACLTPFIVNLFKVMLMIVVLAITLSFAGFLLDILGTKSRLCLTLRTNGFLTVPIGSIFVFCGHGLPPPHYDSIFLHSSTMCDSCEHSLLHNSVD